MIVYKEPLTGPRRQMPHPYREGYAPSPNIEGGLVYWHRGLIMWIVNDSWVTMYPAVIDDFGNLVEVQTWNK